MEEQSAISSRDLAIGFRSAGRRRASLTVADHIDINLRRGEVVCLLGPNGSGKSTLIRTLAGLHAPLDGNIYLSGEHITDLSVKEISRRVSTVLTDRLTIGNISVYDLVAFGRSPYTGWFGSLSPEDEERVAWAIESAGIAHLRERDVLHLSDGERQKVMIARSLAQDTSAILLDEPTAHLDLPNRVATIRLLRALAHETGKAVLLSTHELDLALKAADTLWLLNQKGRITAGTPEDLVLDGTFEAVFEQAGFDFDRSTGSVRLHEPSRGPVFLSGDPTGTFWTRRALERSGYRVNESEKGDIRIEIAVNQRICGFSWIIQCRGDAYSHSSVRELLVELSRLDEAKDAP
ncbi:ABC transporter ATP-binding protein [Fodinibius sediminis]|uniref:Iron complex transport system ATP-binding protein n=1 Tax=Fodinibius sediminis TaxID=1214077 RepID=A0A521B7V6_9BACT|nr:ABC transporter ATP-binding protein [Fodinibius sediminis]SMO43179.1 iron complex transport system ATP-binding protein [Fodinibius sediminis]